MCESYLSRTYLTIMEQVLVGAWGASAITESLSFTWLLGKDFGYLVKPGIT